MPHHRRTGEKRTTTVLSWKAAWLLIASAAALALALLPPRLIDTAALHYLTSIGLGLVVYAAWLLGAHIAVTGAPMWSTLDPGDRALIDWCLRIAGSAYMTWLLVAVFYPEAILWWLAALAVMGGIAYWVAQAIEYLINTRKNREAARVASENKARIEAREALATVLEPGAGSREVDEFRQALAACKLSYLRVVDTEPLGDPPFGRSYRVRRGPNDAHITQAKAEDIAIALAQITGRTILSDWVQVQDVENAGEYLVIVTNEDVMARIHPHREPAYPVVSTITERQDIGFGLDGVPVAINLKRHGRITARSTGGKSSLLDEIIALLTACADVRIWVCGTHKLIDLVAAWCEVYRDTGLPFPFDWVRFGAQDTVDMLAAFLRVSRYRQSLPLRKRGGWPTIILILDEASYVLDGKNQVTAEFDGMDLRTGPITGLIYSGVASADQAMIVATQRDTIDRLGDDGGTIQANLGYDIVGASGDRDAVGRVMGDWKLPKPRHPGQYWLADTDLPGPLQFKAKYPQTDDPTKKVLIRPGDGMRVSEIAWSRRLLPHYGNGIDDGSATAAGAAYLNRPRMWDDEMEAYLQGARSEPRRLPVVPFPRPEAAPVTPPHDGDGGHRGGGGEGAAPDPMPVPTPTGPTPPAPTPAGADLPGITLPVIDIDDNPDDVYARTVEALSKQFGDLLPDGLVVPDGPGMFHHPAPVPAPETADTNSEDGDDGAGSDPVLDAVADLPDSALITMAELGRAAGSIDPSLGDDDAREAARRFSQDVRRRYVLGDDAFTRTARGTALRVGALRAAARSAAR